jgi:RimJ/RimL family protein N-acetyltransferase
MHRLAVTSLTGRHVSLEPLAPDHVDAIAAAGSGDRATFGYTQVPDGQEDAADYVAWLLDDAAHGRAAPFVQRRVSDGVVVGCTRYLNPAWPLGRADPDEVEIGGTWLSAPAQRTAINSEAKLLLLTHAFEVWAVQRVAICTDARNHQSRRAIERLGAPFEGVLRRHRRSTRAGEHGQLRDTAVYSVTVDEWDAVRALVTARLSN